MREALVGWKMHGEARCCPDSCPGMDRIPCAQGPMVVLEGGRFLMSEVPLYRVTLLIIKLSRDAPGERETTGYEPFKDAPLWVPTSEPSGKT